MHWALMESTSPLTLVQADSSTSRTYGGTGIGLSISRCLVELMSGEMDFVSKPNVGSTFTFTAEFQRVPATVPERVLRAGNFLLQTPPLSTIFQGLRALVVDGRQVRCEVTRHHLRRLGIEVINTFLKLIKDDKLIVPIICLLCSLIRGDAFSS